MKPGEYDRKIIKEWLSRLGINWCFFDALLMVHKAQNGEFILTSTNEEWTRQVIAQIRRAGYFAEVKTMIMSSGLEFYDIHGDLFKVESLEAPEQQALW